MRTMEARAVISARDATGNVFGQVAAKMRGMDRQARAVNSSMAAGAMALGRFVGPAAVAYGASRAVSDFASVERQFTRIGITADATREDTSGMLKDAQRLASDLAMPLADVSGGFDALAAQGRKVDEIRAFMPAVAKTAQAAGAEVRDIANAAGAIGDQMQISADKMQAAFDIMVKGGQEGKFELKDMARYLPSLAPLAASIGMKGEEGLKRLVATAQVVRNQTGTAEEAASSLNNIFAKMESEETTKKFSKFGINLRKEMAQARKEGKDLLTVFVGLADRAVKGDLSKIPQLFTDMEFSRGMRALLSQKGGVDALVASLGNAAGTVDNNLNRVLGDTQAKIDRMGEAWGRFSKTVGAGVSGPITAAFDTMSSGIQSFLDKVEKGETLMGRLEAERRARLKAEGKDPDAKPTPTALSEIRQYTDPTVVMGKATAALGSVLFPTRPEIDKGVKDKVAADTAATLKRAAELNERLERQQAQGHFGTAATRKELVRTEMEMENRRLYERQQYRAGNEAYADDDRGEFARRQNQAGMAASRSAVASEPQGVRPIDQRQRGFQPPLPPRRPAELLPMDPELERRRQQAAFAPAPAPAAPKVEPITFEPVQLKSDVSGDINVKVEFNTTLLEATIDRRIAQQIQPLKRQINVQNGPGSTGVSSPDATTSSFIGAP